MFGVLPPRRADGICSQHGFAGGFNLYAYVDSDPINTPDASGLTTWPAGGPMTSPFGRPRPEGPHNGMDISNPMGAPVVASDSGTVTRVQDGPHGEHQIIVVNDDGSQVGYSHVARNVTLHQRVNEGDVIGWTDTSGHSTGPHLHNTFRERPRRQRTDPMNHLRNANPYPRRLLDNQCGP